MRREPPVRIREGLGVKFPRATRLVICCRGTADEAMAAMRGMMSRLKLTVNEAKTRLCRVPEETFDFLGYTIGRCYSPQTGRCLHRDAPVGEEGRAPPGRDPRVDRPSVALDGRRGAGGATEPEAAGLVELLLPGPREPGVPCRGPAQLPPAPPVAACASTRCKSRGTSRFPDRVPARGAGPGPPE